jgi:predicted Zn finger-like uncharacterized protein
MKIICDSCGTKYSISDDKVRGKVFKIRCKKCSHIIVVRGGETQEEAAAPAAAADGGWHIVVEGEQVGPISEVDVRARVERGEIRGDTYIWKEGFADWLKLSTVPEFADIAPPDSGSVNIGDVFTSDGAVQPTNGTERSGSRRRSGANRPLFGEGGGEADVFAAPAASAPSSGGDLFGSASVHSSASSEPRWPSSGGASMAGHDGGRVENLTGQRHENSVLFSLSNLQSLAMPSAKPAPAASFGSAPAPTTEGSGLIDIRAMAANTRGASLEGPSSTTMDDDLPAFGAFSPAAPVLLPMPSSSGPPWWIYLVILGMLGLVGGIGFLAWRVIVPKEVVVVKEVPVPAPPQATKAGAVAAKGAEGDKKPTTIDDKDLPPREGPGTGKDGKDGKDGKEGKEGRESRSHRSSKGSSKDAKKPIAAAEEKKPAGAVAPMAEPPRPKPGSLDALLNDAAPKSANRPKVQDDDKKAGGGGEGPGPLAKNALVAGLKGVQPKVQACYNQYKVPGTAMVNVVIGKSGKVTSATVTGKFAGTPTGTCVEAAVKTASFPPSDGFSTPYPFQLK